MSVYYYSHWWLLGKAEFATSLVPNPVAVSLDERSLNAIHYNTAIVGQHGQHFGDDFIKPSTVSTNEDSIGTRKVRDVCFQKITNTHVNTWGANASGILLDNSFALRSNLEGFDMQMWKLQTSLNADATRAKTNVPKNFPLRQIKCL